MKLASRLWIRLSIAFSSVFIVSLLIIGTMSSTIAGPRNVQGVINEEINKSGGLVDQLEEYYAAHAGWLGIEEFWVAHSNVLWLGADGNLTLSVVDTNNTIISGT